MTIVERRAREACDQQNSWPPICEAKLAGTVCELLFNDMAGNFDADPRRYFVDHDGNRYRIDPRTPYRDGSVPIHVDWNRCPGPSFITARAGT